MLGAAFPVPALVWMLTLAKSMLCNGLADTEQGLPRINPKNPTLDLFDGRRFRGSVSFLKKTAPGREEGVHTMDTLFIQGACSRIDAGARLFSAPR